MKYDKEKFVEAMREGNKTGAGGLSDSNALVMCGVTEYAEEMSVSITRTTGKYEHNVPDEDREGFGREVIHAKNEAGHNCTEVDLEQLLEWIAVNRPQQYAKFITESMMRDYT